MTDDLLTDHSLIESALERVTRGESAAYETVVRRFEKPLRAWLAAHAPPGVDVDDIAQRSFVTAFTRLGEYERATSFAAWLFAIAKYQLQTETTRLRRIADYHARYGPDLLQRELDRRSGEPPEQWTSRLEALHDCVAGLAEHLARFIHWRYHEEIPLEEMARRTGRSIPAVKKQLWKIRQQLQHCVETRIASAEGGSR